jgi:hypothetical protein
MLNIKITFFGSKYNEEQRRQHRHTRQKTAEQYYYEQLNSRKKHAVYEMTLGIYNDEIDKDLKKDIMLDFIKGWEERNPNLELIGIYFHDDEESKDTHYHLDFICKASGYTTGMPLRNGLDKALTQQGFKSISTKNTAQIQWERRENDELERLCNLRGIEVSHPMREAKQKYKHLPTETYKAMKKNEEAEKKANKLLKKRRKNRLPFVSAKEYEAVAYLAECTEETKERERQNKEEARRLSVIRAAQLEEDRRLKAEKEAQDRKTRELLQREREIEKLEELHKKPEREEPERDNGLERTR